jgi:hypothetical protein
MANVKNRLKKSGDIQKKYTIAIEAKRKVKMKSRDIGGLFHRQA